MDNLERDRRAMVFFIVYFVLILTTLILIL